MRGEPGYAGELAAYQKTEVRGQKPEGVCSFAGGLKSRSPGVVSYKKQKKGDPHSSVIC